MVIDVNTGLIVWNPTEKDIGVHRVLVRVSDMIIFVEQGFDLEVVPVPLPNNIPIISSNPPGWATVDEHYYYQVNASDLDAGDVLSYHLLDAPDGMTIDNSTGLISWTPTVGHKDGSYTISVMVTDGKDDIYLPVIAKNSP